MGKRAFDFSVNHHYSCFALSPAALSLCRSGEHTESVGVSWANLMMLREMNVQHVATNNIFGEALSDSHLARK